MAIKGFEKKDPMAGLNQLMQMMNQMDAMAARKEQRLQNEMTAISNQIANATNADSLSSLSNLVGEYNKKVQNEGYDQYSLQGIYDTKSHMYQASQRAYSDAEAILDRNLNDQDALYDDIMSMSFEDASAEMSRLNNILDGMGTGKANKYIYRSNDKYTQTGLEKAVKTRVGQLTNKIEIIKDNQNAFLVYKSDGTLDDESQLIYDDLQFRVMSGDTSYFVGKNSPYDQNVTKIGTKFLQEEKTYKLWADTLNKQQTGESLDDAHWNQIAVDPNNPTPKEQSLINQLKSEFDKNQYSTDYIEKRMEESKLAANKYNKQHQVFTGSYYKDSMQWGNAIDFEDRVENIDGLESGDLTSKTGSKSTEQIVEGESVPGEGEVDDTLETMKFEAGDTTEEDPENIQVNIDNFNEYVESDASEGGIDFNKVTSAVILGGAAASTETVQNVAKSMYKATKDGARYLSTAHKLSAKDIDFIMKEVNKPKGTINVTVDKIKKLEEQLKKIKKDPYNTKKIQIKGQINKLRKNMVESLAKRLDARPEDIARVMKSKEMSKWNPVRVKDYWMNKAPGATKKWLTTSKTAKIGAGLLRYRTGAAIKDAIGFDLGEGFVAETAEDVATTAASTTILNQAGKWLAPKLNKILTTPQGKKALAKFTSKQVAKNIARQVAGSAVPGWGNIAMGLTGLVLTGRDLVRFARNYKEE